MKRWIALAVAALLALGLAGGAMAASNASSSTEGHSSFNLRTTFESNLAAKLGISTATLSTAMRDAALKTVQDAKAAGRIDADQAAKLTARIENGHLPALFAAEHGKRQGGRAMASHRFVIRAAAHAIGVTPRDLITELHSGKSIAQVAEAHGKALADVKAAVLTAFSAHLDQAVQAKRLSADQASRMKTQFASHLDLWLTKTRTTH